MTSAIDVEHVWKSYRVGDLKTFDTLRDKLAYTARAWATRAPAQEAKTAPAIHHALKDVSFRLEPGEVLGIIGRNGAGKSTLLKILARVTAPTRGMATIRGRLAPLLEVGTGFNTELTGRENIYVNGTLLGMSRAEIAAKFDEIVEFAGVHSYIDTPIKRYSTGMMMRLGFAVAAHLDPDILVVDEVLAVGDAAFQRKCLGSMRHVAQQGRTVLFVSHNMASIKALCTRAIWLDDGRVRREGASAEVVGAYLQDTFSGVNNRASWPPVASRRGNHHFQFVDVRIADASGRSIETVLTGQDLHIHLDYQSSDDARGNGQIQMWLVNDDGTEIAKFCTVLAGTELSNLEPEGTIVCRVPRFAFAAGAYSLRVSADFANVKADEIDAAVTFEVANGDFFSSGKLPPPHIPFLCDHGWEIRSKSIVG